MTTKISEFNTKDGSFPSIVVTGVEAFTSLGADIETTWKKLLEGKSGIGAITDESILKYDLPVKIAGTLAFDPAPELSTIELRRYSYPEQLALTVTRKLWNKIGNPEVDPKRLAVCFGTGIGGAGAVIEADHKLNHDGYRKVSPYSVQMSMPNGPAAIVGLEVGAKAGVVAPVSACSTGTEAIAHAWRSLVFGDADMVVVGGVESKIDPVAISSFSIMRALSTRNDDPQAASRPFDKDRDGFVFGEAVAALVLETEEHAKARGAEILGRVMGAGIASDAYHIVAPDPEGNGAAMAMERALHTAGLEKNDISMVIAHATSTPIGDTAEAKAINKAIGNHAAVYAPKGALGHSIGAVGALESILTILSLKEGVIPPTLNLDNQDPAIDLDVVHKEPRKGNYQYAMKSSYGFGGHDVAVAFGKY